MTLLSRNPKEELIPFQNNSFWERRRFSKSAKESESWFRRNVSQPSTTPNQGWKGCVIPAPEVPHWGEELIKVSRGENSEWRRVWMELYSGRWLKVNEEKRGEAPSSSLRRQRQQVQGNPVIIQFLCCNYSDLLLLGHRQYFFKGQFLGKLGNSQKAPLHFVKAKSL